MALSNQHFLDQLSSLVTDRQGSTSITTKRLTYDAPAEDVAMGEAEAEGSAGREWPILVRATDGNGDKKLKVKLSTIVQPDDVDSFTASYLTILRSNLSFLRPKRKKGTKAASKKAKSGPAPAAAPTASANFAVLPRLVGPKRGPGAHKRQRLKRRRAKLVKRLVARRKRDKT